MALAWSESWDTFSRGTFQIEPLRLDHSRALLKTCDPTTFRYYVTEQPSSLSEEDFEVFVTRLVTGTTWKSYVMIESGQLVGCSSFMDLREPHRGLEIGMTWIAAEHRGTKVNPTAKLLMLEHAFERLGCLRVQLKCDARNLHSQAAIAKLGAVREGVLRQHGVLPDGFVRDTVMFSIISEEWPSVKAGLLRRL